MIKKIDFKFGRFKESEAESLSTLPITISVGPNHSGKSKILSEISAFCVSGRTHRQNCIIENVELETLEESQIVSNIDSIKINPEDLKQDQLGRIKLGKNGSLNNVNLENLTNCLLNPNQKNNTRTICNEFLRFKTLKLDGSNRVSLIDDREIGDLKQTPKNSFQYLLRSVGV